MDPISTTLSIAQILIPALSATEKLGSLLSSHQVDILLVASLCSEIAALGGSLAQIQSLLLQCSPSTRKHLALVPDLRQTFDIALSTCMLTVSCLEDELKEILEAANTDLAGKKHENGEDGLSRVEILEDFLEQVRSQKSLIALCIKFLQENSKEDVQSILSDSREHIQRTKSVSQSLRRSFPRIRVPESILDTPSKPTASGSPTTDTVHFDFDDAVINSTVYRRVIANAERAHYKRKKLPRVPVEGDLIDLTEAIGGDTISSESGSAVKDLQGLAFENSNELHESDGGVKLPKEGEVEQRKDSHVEDDVGLSCRLSGPVMQYLSDASAPPQNNRYKTGQNNESERPKTAPQNSEKAQTASKAEGKKRRDSSSDLPIPIVDPDRPDDESIRSVQDSQAARLLSVTVVPPKAAKIVARRKSRQYSAEELGGASPEVAELSAAPMVDWTQPWAAFWNLSVEELEKPPNGQDVRFQETFWRLLQHEERYQRSLQMTVQVLETNTSDAVVTATCEATIGIVRKLQSSHYNLINLQLRECLGCDAWAYDLKFLLNVLQTAWKQFAPIYDSYAWNLPFVICRTATSGIAAGLLSTLQPKSATHHSVLRLPLAHLWSWSTLVKSLQDIRSSGNKITSMTKSDSAILKHISKQLMSLNQSCNHAILARWMELRKSFSLSAGGHSLDLAVINNQLGFPPSQRMNISQLALSHPARRILLRGDMQWKVRDGRPWSRCHGLLFDNYLVLASTNDTKDRVKHRVHALVPVNRICELSPTTETQGRASAKRLLYQIKVITPEFQHLLGYASLLQCLEWHEHLDMAVRAEIMEANGRSSSSSGRSDV